MIHVRIRRQASLGTCDDASDDKEALKEILICFPWTPRPALHVSGENVLRTLLSLFIAKLKVVSTSQRWPRVSIVAMHSRNGHIVRLAANVH